MTTEVAVLRKETFAATTVDSISDLSFAATVFDNLSCLTAAAVRALADTLLQLKRSSAASDSLWTPFIETRSKLVRTIPSHADVEEGALSRAAGWLSWLQESVDRWDEPLVTANADREVVFEWWHSDRKLAVFFSSDTSELIRVWGTDIDTEMEEGSPEVRDEALAAWAWLTA